MLHDVVIDGIKYVPQATIQPVDDDVMRSVLHMLVSLHYFGNWHKAQGITGEAIALLSPDLAAVMDADVGAAFKRVSASDRGE